MKKLRRVLALFLAAAMMTAFAGCQKEVTAEDLMENISPENASENDLPMDFRGRYNMMSFRMLKNAYSKNGGNVVISPLAAFCNLGMLYNAANEQAYVELSHMFDKNMTPEETNTHLHSYVEQLRDADAAKLYFENAMWFNADKNAQPSQDFLQQAMNYYKPAAYRESFNSAAVTNINNWVSNETDMYVEYLLDELPADVPMYMMSAAMLEANWSAPYSYDNVHDGVFTNASGAEESAQMMSGFEHHYLHSESAKGFIKEYTGGNYAFVAILPNKDNISDYLGYLAIGEGYQEMIEKRSSDVVEATIPKFSCESKMEMSDLLHQMGWGSVFSSTSSQMSKLGECDGNFYPGDIYVRTGLNVTEKGTSKGTAASVSNPEVGTGVHVVTLDRPFIFMVVDTHYYFPIIMGVVNSLAE